MRSRLLATAVAAIVGALAALGAVAAAGFVDTGNSPFATEIDNVAAAGCASGFAGNTFRPRDAVTRQQFAAWMNRCGGRVEVGHGAATLAGNSETGVTTAALVPGAVEGGGGFVLVTAALEAATAGAPGSVTFRLHPAGSAATLESVPLTLPAESSAGGAMTTVVPVDGGSTAAFEVTAQRGSADAVSVEADLSLLYVPFAGDGTGGGVE
jgi:hypothetical protein